MHSLVKLFLFFLEFIELKNVAYIPINSNYLLSLGLGLQDIQIRGVNRDDKNIAMAKTFPNSRHFLTYRHSLRVSVDSHNVQEQAW